VARIRSLKPEYWADQKLARCCRDARLLYIALWNFADEQARMVGDPRQVKGLCFALDDDLTAADIDRLLGELAALGRVVRYEVNGERYLFLPKLADHQRLDARQPSRYPPPPEQATPPPENPVPPAPTDFPAEVCGESEEVDAPRARGRSRLQVAGSRLQGSASPRADLAIVEPSSETAQTVLGAYIDWRRAQGVNGIDRRTAGQIAKHLAEAFRGGHPPDVIKLGLARWHEADQHPSTLPSFIDVAARGGQPRASPGKAQRQLDDIQRTYQQMQAMNPEGGERNGDLAAVDRDRRQAQRELP
jgi:hypothetical protein